MDHLEITHETTAPRRSKSLPDMLDMVESALRSIRTEMRLGMQVDEQIVSELESRVERLQQMAATKQSHPSNKQ